MNQRTTRSATRGLALEIREGQRLEIYDAASVDKPKFVINLEHKAGRSARLRISSVDDMIFDLRGERLKVPQS